MKSCLMLNCIPPERFSFPTHGAQVLCVLRFLNQLKSQYPKSDKFPCLFRKVLVENPLFMPMETKTTIYTNLPPKERSTKPVGSHEKLFHAFGVELIIYTTSSQRHTLPNREFIHSNSEVIILNNDQHQHQKIISTNNRINWRIKRQHTTVDNLSYCLR